VRSGLVAVPFCHSEPRCATTTAGHGPLQRTAVAFRDPCRAAPAPGVLSYQARSGPVFICSTLPAATSLASPFLSSAVRPGVHPSAMHSSALLRPPGLARPCRAADKGGRASQPRFVVSSRHRLLVGPRHDTCAAPSLQSRADSLRRTLPGSWLSSAHEASRLSSTHARVPNTLHRDELGSRPPYVLPRHPRFVIRRPWHS
jgi:hypothetical protein